MSPPVLLSHSKPLHQYALDVVQLNMSVYLFAQFGVLLRVLLTESMVTLNGSILPEIGGTFFLQNVVGCLFMGLFAGSGDIFTQKHLQFLQVGLGSGFCGSLTTFGGWVVSVAKEMLSNSHSLRVNAALKVLLNFCCSFMALQFGLHVARICRPIFITDRLSDDSSDNVESNNNSVNRQLQLTRRSKLASLVIAVFLALTIVAFWLLAFYDTPRNYWWIAVCLGPTGALLRYNLSLLNVRFSSFPMFTFLANISASFAGMIILICACRQNVGNEFQFWIVNGVSVGLLGCLSTVSTFINELHKLSAVSLGIAYRYGLVSFFCSLILCLCLGGFWILADKSLNC